jgi:hypothetical protein
MYTDEDPQSPHTRAHTVSKTTHKTERNHPKASISEYRRQQDSKPPPEDNEADTPARKAASSSLPRGKSDYSCFARYAPSTVTPFFRFVNSLSANYGKSYLHSVTKEKTNRIRIVKDS